MGIRTAIVGVGNCAKSLVEGISFYRSNPEERKGLIHWKIGSFAVQDIEIVAAFDIDQRKVGRTLDDALLSEPNSTKPLASIPLSGVIVERGPTLDSVIPELRDFYIHESTAPPADISSTLRLAGAEVVLNYLPTGSNIAAHHYAEASLAANCSFINCMPAVLARSTGLRDRFVDAGLVLLGDDIKSQLGATVLNRTLLELFSGRGVHIADSSQVNYGGNADHFNLRFRSTSKEACKEAALRSVAGVNIDPEVQMIFREDLSDHKNAVITLSGSIFGLSPVRVKLELEDEDSPNSGGVVVDAIRMAKLLRDARIAGDAVDVCPRMMKAPPKQVSEAEAAVLFERVLQKALEYRD